MTTDAAAVASIEAATRELRLPGIRLHAARLAAEAQRAKATYLRFLADARSCCSATPAPARPIC